MIYTDKAIRTHLTNPEKAETTERRQPKNTNKTLFFVKEKPKPNTFVSDLGFTWRRNGDLNPRYAYDVYTISNRAPSTTQPFLHSRYVRISYSQSTISLYIIAKNLSNDFSGFNKIYFLCRNADYKTAQTQNNKKRTGIFSKNTPDLFPATPHFIRRQIFYVQSSSLSQLNFLMGHLSRHIKRLLNNHWATPKHFRTVVRCKKQSSAQNHLMIGLLLRLNPIRFLRTSTEITVGSTTSPTLRTSLG